MTSSTVLPSRGNALRIALVAATVFEALVAGNLRHSATPTAEGDTSSRNIAGAIVGRADAGAASAAAPTTPPGSAPGLAAFLHRSKRRQTLHISIGISTGSLADIVGLLILPGIRRKLPTASGRRHSGLPEAHNELPSMAASWLPP